MSKFRTVAVRQTRGVFGRYGNELEEALKEHSSAGWSLVNISSTPIMHMNDLGREIGQLHTIVFKK